MFRVASYRSLVRFLLGLALVWAASVAFAQDPPKDQPKDQPQDPKAADTAKDADTAKQPADAVDPLKKPVNEKQRKKNARALKQELSRPYKKWLDEDVRWIITDEER